MSDLPQNNYARRLLVEERFMNDRRAFVDYDEHQQQISELETQVAALTAERDARITDEELAVLTEHNEELERRAAELKAERDELRTILGLVQDEQTKAEAGTLPQVEWFTDPVDFARSMAARLVVSRDELKHGLRQAEAERQRLVAGLTALEQERNGLIYALGEMIGEMRRAVAGLGAGDEQVSRWADQIAALLRRTQ